MLRTAEKKPELSRDVEFLRYFRHQLAVLSDEKVLEMFKTLGTSTFSNSQARSFLGSSRQGAWKRLSRLVELGFLERRGHRYRVSSSAEGLITAISSAFRGLLTYKVLLENKAAAREVLQLAKQGVELMYAKGTIQPTDVSKYQKTLAEIEKELIAHDA